MCLSQDILSKVWVTVCKVRIASCEFAASHVGSLRMIHSSFALQPLPPLSTPWKVSEPTSEEKRSVAASFCEGERSICAVSNSSLCIIQFAWCRVYAKWPTLLGSHKPSKFNANIISGKVLPFNPTRTCAERAQWIVIRVGPSGAFRLVIFGKHFVFSYRCWWVADIPHSMSERFCQHTTKHGKKTRAAGKHLCERNLPPRT